ncbi:MAG TPA: DUF4168 domain-containing protein [Acetobacteraceae bacterium]|jgi:hypothetical protein|nr:DUF4168 domain-containing protein [Acetobacteraceae bacterium]
MTTVKPNHSYPSADSSEHGIPDEVIAKMGRALAEIAEVEQELSAEIDGAETEDDRQKIAEQADRAMVEAIEDQGLSVTEFKRIVRTAESDPALRQRLSAAATAA